MKEKIESQYIYLLSPYGLGDTMVLCAFKSEIEANYNGKVKFLIKAHHETVMRLYGIREYDFFDTGGEKLDRELYSCEPQKGKVFVAHPEYVPDRTNLIQFMEGKYSFLEMYRKMLKISDDAAFRLPQYYPALPTSLLQGEDGGDFNHVAFIAPEMNASDRKDRVPLEYIAERIGRLEERGYRVIVNTTKPAVAEKFGNYSVMLSLEEAIAIAINCKYVLSSRSGFSDLIAHRAQNLEVIYPNQHFWEMYNFKRTFDLVDIKETIL